jgi:hypothetical protein
MTTEKSLTYLVSVLAVGLVAVLGYRLSNDLAPAAAPPSTPVARVAPDPEVIAAQRAARAAKARAQVCLAFTRLMQPAFPEPTTPDGIIARAESDRRFLDAIEQDARRWHFDDVVGGIMHMKALHDVPPHMTEAESIAYIRNGEERARAYWRVAESVTRACEQNGGAQ